MPEEGWQDVVVRAADVRVGDYIYDSGAYGFDKWVRVLDVLPSQSQSQVEIWTAVWWTVKHSEEAMTVRRVAA